MLSKFMIKHEAVRFFTTGCNYCGVDGDLWLNPDGYEELFVVVPDGAVCCAEIDYFGLRHQTIA